MAEAARSVKHYVSDCLEERHPYDVQKGFGGRAARDAGKVFDGHVPAGGIDILLASLTDASIGDEERARAVRYLYSHSASQEMKIELIAKGVVPSLVSLLRSDPSAMLEHQCFLLLWSLAVLPQGCYPVVRCGGLDAALGAVRCLDSDEGGHSRTQARAAAASVLAQVTSNFAGLRWALDIEDCSEFVLKGVEYPPAAVSAANASASSSSAIAPSPHELVFGLADALRSETPWASKVGLHCATALAHISSVAPGIHLVAATVSEDSLLALLVAQLTELSQPIVERVADAPAQALPMTLELAYLVQVLTTLWNVAMDQAAVELLDTTVAPQELFRLFGAVQRGGVRGCPLSLQRALTGAISAVSKLTSTKLASTTTTEGAATEDTADTRAVALLHYLQDVNTVVDAAKAAGQQPSNDIIAISKNTVQSIRLASEVKPVRDITHAFLAQLEAVEDSHESFYFRRQLYCGTQWEAEYKAAV